MTSKLLTASTFCLLASGLVACKEETTRQTTVREQSAQPGVPTGVPTVPQVSAQAQPQATLPPSTTTGGVAAEKPKPLPLPQVVKEQPPKADNFSFNACNWRALRAGAAPGLPVTIAPRGDFDRNQGQALQDCTPPTSMVMSDFKAGEGKVVESRKAVMVHYTGWLYDASKPDGKGAQFDSSRERPLGLSFFVGVGRVIKGWDEGVVGMREGGRRLLIIPPNMAYGDRAGGPIPPGSTLIFDVEVLRVLQ
jgi:FKBP-type peptidyl-prolyl cis-trans isomerase FkpA